MSDFEANQYSHSGQEVQGMISADFMSQFFVQELLEEIKRECKDILHVIEQGEFPYESHGLGELMEHHGKIGLLAGKVLAIRSLYDVINSSNVDENVVENLIHD